MIYHATERHAVTDLAEIERRKPVIASWDALYATGRVKPAHYWEKDYGRTARSIGDERNLPYLHDLLRFALAKCQSDHDLILLTNDDIILHPQIIDLIEEEASHQTLSAHRAEIVGPMPPLSSPPALFAELSRPHQGRDAFLFRASWLHRLLPTVPDFILGAPLWDLCLAAIVRRRLAKGILGRSLYDVIPGCELPKGYVIHKAHQSRWTNGDSRTESKANEHNAALWHHFTVAHLGGARFRVLVDGSLSLEAPPRKVQPGGEVKNHTVVITTYQRIPKLIEAIESCQRATVRRVIVTATGDLTGLEAVEARFKDQFDRFTVLRHGPEVTANQSWFRGVEAADTPYVGILHDDDLLLPDYGKIVSRIIASKADFGAMQARNHGCPDYLDAISRGEGFLPSAVIQGKISQPHTLAISPIRGVFKRDDLSAWLRIADGLPRECYYRPDFLVGNDLLIWLEACRKYGRFFHVAEAGVSHGHWDGSTTIRDLSTENRLFAMYDRVREWFAAGRRIIPKIQIVTIVLDGMPFITWHLPVFNALGIPWHWHIVEGAAMNTHCTKWCKPQEPRLSADGTTEFLDSLSTHPHISVYRRKGWDGKVSMLNAALEHISDPCVLLEVDADEVWTTAQIESLVKLFQSDPSKTYALFWCQYYLGPNIILANRNCWANNPHQEWKRAWAFKPGMRFERHEPPVMTGEGEFFDHATTEKAGLVFHHYAYVFENQLAYKEKFYGYNGAASQWRKFQANDRWPTRLADHLSWVKDNALARPI